MTAKKRLLTRTAASQYLHDLGRPVSPNTLAKLAVNGGGPPFVKFMSRALYDPDDLDYWAATKTSAKRTSTSEDNRRLLLQIGVPDPEPGLLQVVSGDRPPKSRSAEKKP
jgi:hypothetical protein